MPEWQRIAGKAAKEVEKFAKEKADLVLMHWRDKMGIVQKEVSKVHCKTVQDETGSTYHYVRQYFYNLSLDNDSQLSSKPVCKVI